MKKIKISFILNIITIILVVLSTSFMLLGIKFMPSKNLLIVDKFENFKFYTIDSNILIGIMSLILAIYEYKLVKGKIKEIPNIIYILKTIGISCISLTFLITLLFLMPQYGFYGLYNNSNLFFHLIVPLVSIIGYIFFEKHDNKYKYALYAVIPTILYSVFYAVNVLTHLNNGGLTFDYDFYGFLQGNINNIYFVMPIMYLIAYLISLLAIFLNKKFAK